MHLKIFWQLVADGISWDFSMSGASQIVALDISKIFARIWHLVLFFGLSSSFLGDRWLYMGNLHGSVLSMLIFFSAPFWALLFSCYTLMIFMMILAVILLPML